MVYSPCPWLQFYETSYGFLVIILETSHPNKPSGSYVTFNAVTPFSLSTSLISVFISPFSLHPPYLLSSPLPSLLFLPPSLSIPLKGLLPHQHSQVCKRETFPIYPNLLLILNSFFFLCLNGIPWERLLRRPLLSSRESCVSHPCPSLHLPQ